MVAPSGNRQGILQVVPPAALEAQLQQRQQAQSAAFAPDTQAPPEELGGFIRTQFEMMRNHRNSAAGWSGRLIEALRTFNGQYSPAKLREVQKFGGSEIYARITAQRCRAASSLLRDIYLGQDRPWAVKPPADPDVPLDILEKIKALLQHEEQTILQSGQPPDEDGARKRREALLESAAEAAKKKATKQAKIAEDRIEEYLREGGFYHALAEFIVDLPIFLFACIKGPTVKIVPEVVWPPGGGQPIVQQVPKMFWTRVSPFDVWWTPGVADIANADVIEKSRLTRAEINDLLDLPGYDRNAVRAVLEDYGRGGLYEHWDTTDAERATLESRENPAWNRSGLITMLEYHGNVQGRILQDYGLPGVSDELRDYRIDAYLIGRHVIKVNLSPSPRARHSYFTTSFEKVPGTPLGNSLADMISDLQDAANATLRSLLNNMGIASGPQVVINTDRVRPEDNIDELFPWKRWHATNDPVGNNSKTPVEFFQPNSNAQELLTVYKSLVEFADDISGIPKYVGGSASGGAGRTASGLAMLMGNASKILQTVAANIDRDIFEVALQQLGDLVMLTDTTGLLTGEEKFYVQGTTVAVQRETQRQRQLEFLQHTNNPVDMSIVGLTGRGSVLRSVADTIGLSSDKVVPSEAELLKKQAKQQDEQQNKAIHEQVDKGIQKGVEMGVQSITKELTTGFLASRASMPEEGGQPPAPGGMDGNPPGPPSGASDQDARQAQGSQASPMNNAPAMGVDVVGNQRKPPQPGQRLPGPVGGPG